MQVVRGFKGIRYNFDFIKDLSTVVIPPYDIISPQFREYLANLSEYNFVHIDLPVSEQALINKYEHAGRVYSTWKSKGVFIKDDVPKAYWLLQQFKDFSGVEYSRLALLALVKLPLDETDAPKIFPHEMTFDKPVEDRKLLFNATNSELSPVFLLFSDYEDKLRKIYDLQLASSSVSNSVLEFTTPDGVFNRYFISNWDDILTELFSNKVFYIADGHHRFRMALENFKEKVKFLGRSAISVNNPYMYLFSALVALEDPGLLIYSPHRVVKSLPPDMSIEKLMDLIKEFFDVIPCGNVNVHNFLEKINSSEEIGNHSYGVLTKSGNSYLIKLKKSIFETLVKSEAVKVIPRVCVYPLHRFIFDVIEKNYGYKVDLDYEPDINKCKEYLSNGKAEMVFLLGKISPTIVKECAEAGEFMPHKSTYFFPKIPSGLVIYELTEESL